MQVKDINDFAAMVANLNENKAILEQELADIAEELTALEQNLIEALVSENIKEWVNERGKFSIKISTYWNIKDQEKCLEYFKTNDPSMIKLHPTTIRGYFNDLLESQKIKEEDFLNIGVAPYQKKSILLRKGKG